MSKRFDAFVKSYAVQNHRNERGRSYGYKARRVLLVTLVLRTSQSLSTDAPCGSRRA
jgi:hypothetical protein